MRYEAVIGKVIAACAAGAQFRHDLAGHDHAAEDCGQDVQNARTVQVAARAPH
jgi:hypothetical protein